MRTNTTKKNICGCTFVNRYVCRLLSFFYKFSIMIFLLFFILMREYYSFDLYNMLFDSKATLPLYRVERQSVDNWLRMQTSREFFWFIV